MVQAIINSGRKSLEVVRNEYRTKRKEITDRIYLQLNTLKEEWVSYTGPDKETIIIHVTDFSCQYDFDSITLKYTNKIVDNGKEVKLEFNGEKEREVTLYISNNFNNLGVIGKEEVQKYFNKFLDV